MLHFSLQLSVGEVKICDLAKVHLISGMYSWSCDDPDGASIRGQHNKHVIMWTVWVKLHNRTLSLTKTEKNGVHEICKLLHAFPWLRVYSGIGQESDGLFGLVINNSQGNKLNCQWKLTTYFFFHYIYLFGVTHPALWESLTIGPDKICMQRKLRGELSPEKFVNKPQKIVCFLGVCVLMLVNQEHRLLPMNII